MTVRLSILLVALVSLALYGQDADPKQRARQARDLARQGSEAIPKLQAMVADPDRDVRIEAVKGLVQIGTQRSLDALVQATRDPDPEIQIRATDGLVNFYAPGYVESGVNRIRGAIRSRFERENDEVIAPFIEVREDVVTALGRLARGGSSMESRANAARAAGILRGKAAVPDLIEALRSKDDDVMFESLIALQKIRDPEAAPKISFLLRDLQERIQIAAIETTGLLQNREAISDLQKVYERATSKRVRRAALGALAMLPDERNRPYYQKGFADQDEGVRAAAAEGLGRLGNAGDQPTLEAAFRDERKMLPRLALAFSLVKLGTTDLGEFSPLRYLVNTLNSRQHRGVAEPYLNELARQEAVRNALQTTIRQGTKDEKIALGRVLATTGDRSSVAYLEPLTKDPDSDVAQESLRALRTLKARIP